MKPLNIVLIGCAVVGAASVPMIRWNSHHPPASTTAALPASPTVAELKPPARSVPAPKPAPVTAGNSPSPAGLAPVSAAMSSDSVPTEAPAPAPAKPSRADWSRPLLKLVAAQSSYAEKQSAWNELRSSGELTKAIADLETAARSDPSVAEYPAVLGQAYIQQLMVTQDERDRVMLAMKADQSFDQALRLDPTNWEARFTKASALSYWPAEMNKSEEVMQQLVTLAEQQETLSPQPQFAQTYLLLGDQYQKAGYSDLARQTWQRGANLFPNNDTLRKKLAP